MDLSLFNKEGNYTYYLKVGSYEMKVYTGKMIYTTSRPMSEHLPLTEYTVLGFGLYTNGCVNVSLKGISLPYEEIKSNAYQGCRLGEDYFYNLTISELENVYNKLCEIAGICETNNSATRELPCKRCGKMNDLGASVCWSLTCGVDNPTNK